MGAFLGDKAYDSNWIIDELNQRGTKIVISQMPQRTKPIVIDLEMYKWGSVANFQSWRVRT